MEVTIFPVLSVLRRIRARKPFHTGSFSKANWDLFRLSTSRQITPEVLNSEDPALTFSTLLVQCAKDSIPKSSSKPKGPKTPWFNEECQAVNQERKRAQRHMFQYPTSANKIAHQKLRAQSRFIYKKSKKSLLAQFLF